MIEDNTLEQIMQAARNEVAAERFRERVEQEKVRLRQRRTWGDRLFGWLPFTITMKEKK